jgi:hypothetical protein
VRDGLGATREAIADEDGGQGGAASLWRLTTAIESEDDILVSERPVAGTPAFAIEYAETATSTPAWPWLRSGFLGVWTRDGEALRLGVDLAAAHAGGPVLDRAGRLVGMALRDLESRATMRPASLWPVRGDIDGGAARGRGGANGPASDLAFDRLYEHALRVTLQVIALP